jgi:L-arabinose isomerase
MTAAILQKNMSFLNNTKGETVAVQIDLRNQTTKRFFEDLMDTLTVIERQDEIPRSFDEFEKEYNLNVVE